MTSREPEDPATIEKCLILGHGFHEDELQTVLDILIRIQSRIHKFSANQVSFEIQVKDRDHNDQKITLEGVIGKAHIVASTEGGTLEAAVADTRDEFLREYDDWNSSHRL